MRTHASLLLCAMFTSGIFGATTEPNLPQKEKEPLAFALGAITDRTGIHFTIESDHRDLSHDSYLDTVLVNEPAGSLTGDVIVANLSTALPGAAVLLDAHDNRIVHLIDKSLSQPSGGVMDELCTVRFDGTPDALADTISTNTGGKVFRNRVLVANEPSGDGATQIHVDANKLPVRSVLSCWLPIDKYSTILWYGECCKSREGKFAFFVRFNGPANR